MGKEVSPYYRIRQKAIFDILDEFPEYGNLTIARLIYHRTPEFFASVDQARSMVRYYRGVLGEKQRNKLTNRKYVRKPI